ncbi:hypothetical protein M0805_000012 [Coniferiporia weirii]|nr:hypothetical protein M0805_000012 [Coniferiporia weirii]
MPEFLIPDDNLQGEIIGTGADGTTYLLSNIVTDTVEDEAYTMTFVQDATHISEVLIATMDQISVALNAECSYDATSGLCVAVDQDVQDGFSTVITTTQSGSLLQVPVLVSAGSDAGSAANSAQITAPTTAASSGSTVETGGVPATTASSSGSAPSNTQSASAGFRAIKLPVAAGIVGIILQFLGAAAL